jgi:uncharacterized membrane protein YphA (DoxX/SURF4 family)
MNRLTPFIDKHKQYGTFIVRIGIAVVFLWFGIDKFVHTNNWIGWVPMWMRSLIPISLTSFMYIQGVIETLVGFLLLIGFKTRFAAFLAVITLLGVELSMVGTGQVEIMLRDAGLLAASLSLFFTGSNFLSVDAMIKK